MKKILAILTALCLLCGVIALADTTITNTTTDKTANTEVQLSVGISYTVTIPADVTIDLDSRSGVGTVTVAANPRIPSGDYLVVMLQGTANGENQTNYLVNKDDATAKIPYNIYLGDDTTNIYSFTALLSVAGGADETSADLNFVIDEDTEIQYAGDYSDTLTFTVAVR